MMRRFAKALTLAALAYLAILLILAAPLFIDSGVELVNNATDAVSVVAVWRGNQKKVDGILQGNSRRFSINDEGAVKFRVRYADGRERESEPVYFSSGITLIVTISEHSVKVRYASETR